MSDPRLDAVENALLDQRWPDGERIDAVSNKTAHDFYAPAVLAAADAADLLLPKVRALYEAVRVYHFDPVTVPALPDLPPAGARVRRAFDAFTPDDLARLGVTRAGE